MTFQASADVCRLRPHKPKSFWSEGYRSRVCPKVPLARPALVVSRPAIVQLPSELYRPSIYPSDARLPSLSKENGRVAVEAQARSLAASLIVMTKAIGCGAASADLVVLIVEVPVRICGTGLAQVSLFKVSPRCARPSQVQRCILRASRRRGAAVADGYFRLLWLTMSEVSTNGEGSSAWQPRPASGLD